MAITTRAMEAAEAITTGQVAITTRAMEAAEADTKLHEGKLVGNSFLEL